MTPQDLAAVLRGEPAATRQFLQEYEPVIRQAVLRRLKGRMREDADDVVHEIIVLLLLRCPETGDLARDLRKYNPAVCPLRSFVYYYADKRTLDWMRKWQRRNEHEGQFVHDHGEGAALAAAPSGDSDSIPDWLPEVLRRFEAECSDEERRLYQLYFIEERSGQEVADLMVITPGAVFTRAKRLREKLIELRDKVRKTLLA